jgi:hypothetical protein
LSLPVRISASSIPSSIVTLISLIHLIPTYARFRVIVHTLWVPLFLQAFWVLSSGSLVVFLAAFCERCHCLDNLYSRVSVSCFRDYLTTSFSAIKQ